MLKGIKKSLETIYIKDITDVTFNGVYSVIHTLKIEYLVDMPTEVIKQHINKGKEYSIDSRIKVSCIGVGRLKVLSSLDM